MPASRIIVLAYDDIANDYSNPFPGKIFNKPDPKGKGVDVYASCKIDYKGGDVTPENFLNVLKGDATANKGKGNGRVLASTASDKVFVYFTDHGATGLIAFPSGELYANDMIDALKYMHDNNMYKRLVFYLEACESGSMFDKILPNNWEIYATTAANPNESSWATYCSPDDKINGKSIGSCLGDEYSVIWMEDTEAAEEGKHLQKQFEDVKSKTQGSHVMQYGILDWTDESITNYQGDVAERNILERFINRKPNKKYKQYLNKAKASSVDSRDVKLHYLMTKFTADKTKQNEALLGEELSYRKSVDNFFSKFNENFTISAYETTVSSFACLKSSVNAFKSHCSALWGEYTLKYIKNINTACNMSDAETVAAHLKSAC
jgi:legumain